MPLVARCVLRKKKLCPYICHYDQQGNFIRRRPPWTRLIRAEEDAEEEEREEEENRAVFDQRQPLLVISMEEDGKDRGVSREQSQEEKIKRNKKVGDERMQQS